jgi:hypothetical protein
MVIVLAALEAAGAVAVAAGVVAAAAVDVLLSAGVEVELVESVAAAVDVEGAAAEVLLAALRSASVIPGGSWILLGPKSHPTIVGSVEPRFWMNISPNSPLTSVILEVDADDEDDCVGSATTLAVTLLIMNCSSLRRP